MPKGKEIKYSAQQLAWIESNRHLPRREAHRMFCDKFKRMDVTFDNYKALCTRRGWITGRTGCFEKGIIPHNLGKKFAPGKGGNHPNARKSQFKKGHIPPNANYVGHERIDKKDGYVYVNIAERDPNTGYSRHYVLKHKYLWEQENGKLPDGMCLKCLDGNRQNTDPKNWQAIPRGALPFLNGHRGHNYEEMPNELKPSVLILAKVKHAKSKLNSTKDTGNE